MKRKQHPAINLHDSSAIRKKNTLHLVDRISDLPNSILGRILSNLPTKDAVATSILSKRWKSVWMNVRNLHFCLEEGGMVGQSVEKCMKFAQFVNRVLLLLDGRLINKFRLLLLDGVYVPSELTEWINTAITRNVNDLSISLQCFGQYDDDDGGDDDDDGGDDDDDDDDDQLSSQSFQMPASVFSSDSLRCLELKGRIYVSDAIVVCLPRLETLKLHSVYFKSEDVFENLISGCPMLNYLHLDMDMDDLSSYFDDLSSYIESNNFTYSISSTSLRRLELRVEYSDDSSPPDLLLEAESLEYLKLDWFIPLFYMQGTLSSLVEVDFKIRLCEDGFSEETCNSVVEALGDFDCAKSLILSPDVMLALSKATICVSTKFGRLTELEAGTCSCYCSSLQYIIQCLDNLEVLTINQNVYPCDHNRSKWTAPVEVPRCLSNSLKVVSIYGYRGYEDEREMIGYVLKHGNALERMLVNCYPRDRKPELLKEIYSFPRKSPACEIV